MNVFLIVAVITAVVAFASDHPPARMVMIPLEQALPVSERYGVHNVGDGRTVPALTWAPPAAAQRPDSSSEASSQSAQEAAASRYLASLAPAPPAEPGNRRPAFQIPDGEPLRWIFDTSAASSSTEPPGTRQIIPQFVQVEGSSEAASRSAQEAAASRHLASLAPAPPEPGNRRPAFQTPDGKPLRWISDTSAASSSTGPPGTRKIIPQFLHVESGRVWGPLPIGDEKFSMKSYPLDIGFFHHLYGDTLAVPADFEGFVTDRPIHPSYRDTDTFPNQPAAPVQKRIDASGTSYRPEPAVLQAVHDAIWQPLGQSGIRPGKLPQSDVFEGEYLWPPVEAHSDSQHLFPMSTLLQRIRAIISTKFRSALSGDPSLFHLNVDVNGQIRHILMFPTVSGYYVKHTNTPLTSTLWLLYEGMTVSSDGGRWGRRQLSLLGATYLPKEVVPDYLQDIDVLTVAFGKHMNVLH
ncbi:hypothetical protein NDA11_005435 [Ustilago hordei]|nr:hypothetical protein NDA11_005435 [Ustilago hordei]